MVSKIHPDNNEKSWFKGIVKQLKYGWNKQINGKVMQGINGKTFNKASAI